MNKIQEFYNQHHFPGPYTLDQLKNYDVSVNRYVSLIDQYIGSGQRVLDLGCGTGLLTNLFAIRYTSEFVGVDFSTAADYATTFAKSNQIKNVEFVKQDFFEFNSDVKFDVIVGQSFLTHVPDYISAVEKIKQLLAPGGVIILGMFHPAGNLIKRICGANYSSDRLRLDQESHPFEQAFNKKQMLELFSDYNLVKITPSINNHLVWLRNLTNAKNGGLTMYVFKDNNEY